MKYGNSVLLGSSDIIMEIRSNIQGIRWSAPPLTDSQLSLCGI